MAATIQITDDSTTVTLKVLYDDWRPARSRRNRSRFGPVYVDVQESIPITLTGTDAATVRSNLTELSELLDQADAWKMGENVSAVKLKVTLDSGTAVQSVIWDADLQIPAGLITLVSGTRIGTDSDPMVLNCTRRGLWLGASEVETSSTSTGNPAILTSSAFTDTATIPWPYSAQIDLDCGVGHGIASTTELFALFSNEADKLYLSEAESLTLGTDVSSQSIATASAGNVARVDCSNTTITKTITDSSPGMDSAIRVAAFWAVVRNRSASTVSYDIALQVWPTGASSSFYETGPTTTIAAGDNNIKVVFLGMFSLNNAVSKIQLRLTNDVTGTATTDDLDIDYICGIGLDESARMIYIPDASPTYTGDTELHIEHRLGTKLTPFVRYSDSGDINTWGGPGYTGDAILCANGSAISCLVFGAVTSTTAYWVIVDTNFDELNLDLSVNRTKAYLTPT